MKSKARNLGRTFLSACLGLALLAGAAAGASRFVFFAPDPKTAVYDLEAAVPADALHFKPYTRTPHMESFYYQFDNHDGSDFFCHLFFADLGLGMKRFGIDYKLRYPSGKTTFFGAQYDPAQTELAGDRFDWKIGPHRLSGDASEHHLQINDGPMKLDVTFKVRVPLFRVGEGKMFFGDRDRKEGMITYFPSFAVSGTMQDGRTVATVAGWGYGNQVKQDFLAEMFELHTALRWQKDDLGFDVHDYITPKAMGSEWLPILMVHRHGKMIHVSQNYKKENLEFYDEPRSKKRIPVGYRVVSEAQDFKIVIEFTQVKLGDYNDPLLSLGPLEKYMLQLLTESPLDLRFDGRVRLTITTPAETVVMEGPGHGLALVAQ
jgi:hypothetical protein